MITGRIVATVALTSLLVCGETSADTPIIPGFVGEVSPTNIDNGQFIDFLDRNHGGPVFLKLHVEEDYVSGLKIDTSKLCDPLVGVQAKRFDDAKPDKAGVERFYLSLPDLAIELGASETPPTNIYDLLDDPRVVGTEPGHGPKSGAIDCSAAVVFEVNSDLVDADGHATSTLLYKVQGVFNVRKSYLGGVFVYDLRGIKASPEWLGALSLAYPDSR